MIFHTDHALSAAEKVQGRECAVGMIAAEILLDFRDCMRNNSLAVVKRGSTLQKKRIDFIGVFEIERHSCTPFTDNYSSIQRL